MWFLLLPIKVFIFILVCRYLLAWGFGICLGALCAVCFYIGWRMGIDNYLKRAREHVKKYGDKLW